MNMNIFMRFTKMRQKNPTNDGQDDLDTISGDVRHQSSIRWKERQKMRANEKRVFILFILWSCVHCRSLKLKAIVWRSLYLLRNYVKMRFFSRLYHSLTYFLSFLLYRYYLSQKKKLWTFLLNVRILQCRQCIKWKPR